MAKVDLITLSAITASDGSIIASGATLKFDSEFFAASTKIRIKPKLYRNRELFESGYTNIRLFETTIPDIFEITFDEQTFYGLTPLQLYTEVGNWINNRLGGTYFELKIIDG